MTSKVRLEMAYANIERCRNYDPRPPEGRTENEETIVILGAEIDRLRATLTDLWGYTQGLEKIIRDGVYRSEELKVPDAWKDCDVWQFDGTGASITMQVEEALAGFSAETGVKP